MDNNIITSKKCTGCREVKDIELFSKDRWRKDGKCTRCKECNSKTFNNWSVKKKLEQEQLPVDIAPEPVNVEQKQMTPTPTPITIKSTDLYRTTKEKALAPIRQQYLDMLTLGLRREDGAYSIKLEDSTIIWVLPEDKPVPHFLPVSEPTEILPDEPENVQDSAFIEKYCVDEKVDTIKIIEDEQKKAYSQYTVNRFKEKGLNPLDERECVKCEVVYPITMFAIAVNPEETNHVCKACTAIYGDEIYSLRRKYLNVKVR